MPHLDIATAIVVLAPATKGMAEVLAHMSPAASSILQYRFMHSCSNNDTCLAQQAGMRTQSEAHPTCTHLGHTDSQTQSGMLQLMAKAGC